MKTCSKCKEIKDFSDFYICKNRAAGYRSSCKSCMDKSSSRRNAENPFPARKAKANYKNSNPDKNRDVHLKYKYGIGIKEYGEMLAAQNGVCAICERPERFVAIKTGLLQKLVVDHCHKTGKIRGLLCRACNSALGQLMDSKNVVKSALDYLEKNG